MAPSFGDLTSLQLYSYFLWYADACVCMCVRMHVTFPPARKGTNKDHLMTHHMKY